MQDSFLRAHSLFLRGRNRVARVPGTRQLSLPGSKRFSVSGGTAVWLGCFRLLSPCNPSPNARRFSIASRRRRQLASRREDRSRPPRTATRTSSTTGPTSGPTTGRSSAASRTEAFSSRTCGISSPFHITRRRLVGARAIRPGPNGRLRAIPLCSVLSGLTLPPRTLVTESGGCTALAEQGRLGRVRFRVLARRGGAVLSHRSPQSRRVRIRIGETSDCACRPERGADPANAQTGSTRFTLANSRRTTSGESTFSTCIRHCASDRCLAAAPGRMH